MRINRNKQKGKNTIKEKKTTKIKNLVVAPAGFEPAPKSSSIAKIEASYRWAMRPLHNRYLKINSLDVFFSPIHTVLTLWGCIYHEFKDTCEGKKLKRVFQNDFALFPYLSTLGLYIGHSMNALVYFFAALPEAQVAVLRDSLLQNGTRSFFVR